MSADAAASIDAFYQAALRGLVVDGAKISSDLANEPGSAIPKAEPYERITRGVRRTIILARHIAEHPIQQSTPETAKTKVTLARRRIARAIDDDIVYAEQDPERIDSLRNEFRERLEDPDLDLEILHGKLDDVIDDIRRDLGLANSRYAGTSPRRTPDQVRDLYAAARPAETPEPDDDEDEDDPADDVDAPSEDDHPLVAAILKRRQIRDG